MLTLDFIGLYLNFKRLCNFSGLAHTEGFWKSNVRLLSLSKRCVDQDFNDFEVVNSMASVTLVFVLLHEHWNR